MHRLSHSILSVAKKVRHFIINNNIIIIVVVITSDNKNIHTHAYSYNFMLDAATSLSSSLMSELIYIQFSCFSFAFRSAQKSRKVCFTHIGLVVFQ